MTELETRWIAGWLEGEGTFGINKNTPRVSAVSTDLDTLQRVISIVGGNISGPRQKEQNKPIWCWHLYGNPAAKLMKTIHTLMSIRRQERIHYVLEQYIERTIEEQHNFRSNVHKGIPKSLKHREAISAARKGMKFSEEVRLNMSNAQIIAAKLREEKKRATKTMPPV